MTCITCSLANRHLHLCLWRPIRHRVDQVFAEHLRKQAGKNIWMMGGGEIIGSFLDESAIDQFTITVVPTFIGEGIPLISPGHREVPLRLRSLQRFPDGVVQLQYDVQQPRR